MTRWFLYPSATKSSFAVGSTATLAGRPRCAVSLSPPVVSALPSGRDGENRRAHPDDDGDHGEDRPQARRHSHDIAFRGAGAMMSTIVLTPALSSPPLPAPTRTACPSRGTSSSRW